MIQRPFSLQKWIEDHRHLLQPPVGNKRIWTDSEFIVMVVGGPNSRKDFHYNEGEEFFYQLEGDIVVKIQEEGRCVEVPIRQGEIFLLPPRVPHNPCRPAHTVGLVIERQRRPGELDGLLWFCEKCNHKLYEEYFPLTNIETDFGRVFQTYYGSLDLRTCKACGAVMEPPPKPV
ncbi:MAG: 3-hydroxyanthranilate 3,4-dioxygenase [Flavobacteriales bacterium]|nr:3-hydroxyanthranilate 3,4-dioxygenase [Flavobacteriales bacterium]MCX7767582.1 3-hydroxyanthranilate 3,4-dioxygenase [Flavobacteriales bacterium]MDW8410247.1 3-hydroxyanthranilate 3,4-dioxygenase [Flavobacteriales bacterium]